MGIKIITISPELTKELLGALGLGGDRQDKTSPEESLGPHEEFPKAFVSEETFETILGALGATSQRTFDVTGSLVIIPFAKGTPLHHCNHKFGGYQGIEVLRESDQEGQKGDQSATTERERGSEDSSLLSDLLAAYVRIASEPRYGRGKGSKAGGDATGGTGGSQPSKKEEEDFHTVLGTHARSATGSGRG